MPVALTLNLHRMLVPIIRLTVAWTKQRLSSALAFCYQLMLYWAIAPQLEPLRRTKAAHLLARQASKL
jgi:hypothetical protein